jgi:hypothetical protein
LACGEGTKKTHRQVRVGSAPYGVGTKEPSAYVCAGRTAYGSTLANTFHYTRTYRVDFAAPVFDFHPPCSRALQDRRRRMQRWADSISARCWRCCSAAVNTHTSTNQDQESKKSTSEFKRQSDKRSRRSAGSPHNSSSGLSATPSARWALFRHRNCAPWLPRPTASPSPPPPLYPAKPNREGFEKKNKIEACNCSWAES